MSTTITIASGQTASPSFTLARALPFAVLCSSQAGGAVGIEFATTSGGAGGSWAPLTRMDGSGLPHTVASGAQLWGVVATAPTPWARLVQTIAAPTPRSFDLYELNVSR